MSTLETKRMRQANNAYQLLFAYLVSCCAMFFLYIFFNEKSGVISFVVIFVISFLLASLFDQFSKMAGLVAYLLSALFVFKAASLVGQLHSNPSGKLSVSIILSFATWLVFGIYAQTVLKLKPYERAVLKVSKFRKYHLLFNANAYGVSLMKSMFSWLIDLVSTLSRGISSYFLMITVGLTIAPIFMILTHIIRFKSIGQVELSDEKIKLIGMVILFYLILFVAFVVLSKIAMLLKRVSRYFSRSSYEDIVSTDQRSPILFLRSFKNDQVTLPKLRLFQKYWQALPEPRRLDHLLLEEFSYIGPVVAIGKPGELELPYGAARLYVDEEHWQSTVLEIARKAIAVVLVADNTSGLSWEIETMMSEAGFMEKTLFLNSPSQTEFGLQSHPMLEGVLDQYCDDNFVIASYCNGDELTVISSDTFCADDYLIACKAFFNAASHKKT